MKFPWWVSSWTVRAGFGAIVLSLIGYRFKLIHQVELELFHFQSFVHIVLRFKTEDRKTKLSDSGPGKEEG